MLTKHMGTILSFGMALTLSGCAGSGADRAPAAINPVPGDIRAEFRRVTPAPSGPMTRSESLRYAGRLMVSEERKNAAGRRLINQIDRARAFHQGD